MLSAALTVPMTKLCINPVFSMMGANFDVDYEINPLQVYVLYPTLVLLITVASAAITALNTRRITPRECAGTD